MYDIINLRKGILFMDKYFVGYKIYFNDGDDYLPKESIAFNIDKPVDSIYGLKRIDITKRGGPISIFKGDIKDANTAKLMKDTYSGYNFGDNKHPMASKIIKTFAFVDKQDSERDFGTQPDADGKRIYWVYIGYYDITRLKLDKEVEVVDWNYYDNNYESLHEEYLANHSDDDSVVEPKPDGIK